MSASDHKFRHSISKPFLAALHDLVASPQGQWWRDVLVHHDLVLAVRNDTLNVYHRGGSIFRIVFHEERVVPETHVKYLVRQRQAYATMDEHGQFMYKLAVTWPAYEGAATLNEMIAAAKGLAGPEKTGLHALIVGNPNVTDVEVAFRSTPKDDGKAADTQAGGDDIHVLSTIEDDGTAEISSAKGDLSHQDRLDAVTLEEREGALWIVFHEAKHFANAAAPAPAGCRRSPDRSSATGNPSSATPKTSPPAIGTSARRWSRSTPCAPRLISLAARARRPTDPTTRMQEAGFQESGFSPKI